LLYFLFFLKTKKKMFAACGSSYVGDA
jgi:hypothetical protein